MDATKLKRCPDPTEPGLYLCRRHRGSMCHAVKVARDRENCLMALGSYGIVPISEFGLDAKWWGPIELGR